MGWWFVEMFNAGQRCWEQVSHSEYTSESFDKVWVSALTNGVKLLACDGYHAYWVSCVCAFAGLNGFVVKWRRPPQLKCHVLNLAVMMNRVHNEGRTALDCFQSFAISLSGCTCHFCLCIVKSLAQAPSIVNPLHSCDSGITLFSSSCRQPSLWILSQCGEHGRMQSISLVFHWLMAVDVVTKTGIVFCCSSRKNRL